MSDSRERLIRHPFCCGLIAAACALILSGCDKKPEPIEYTGETVHWRKAGSSTMSCDTFRPRQYPVLCIQLSGERRLLGDPAPSPEPEVPRGVFYPDYQVGLDKGGDLPRPQMPVSAFEKEDQRAGGERYFGPNVQFAGTILTAGLATDNVAQVTIRRSEILFNSAKVVSLDDFKVNASQKKAGKPSLYLSPLFEEMSLFEERQKQMHELLEVEHEPPAVTVLADKSVPFRLIHAVLSTLSEHGTTDYHFLLESGRQTEALHCAHFEDDGPRSGPVRWWRCYDKPGARRVATELQFVDIGALGPVGYLAPRHLEPDQTRHENIVFVGPHGFLVALDGIPIETVEGCDRSDVTVCNRDGELDYAALHALLRGGEAAGADAFLVRPAGSGVVTYEQMLTTTQLLSRPSPTKTFSDTDELFEASRSDEGELTPLVSRVSWAGRMPKERWPKPAPTKLSPR